MVIFLLREVRNARVRSLEHHESVAAKNGTLRVPRDESKRIFVAGTKVSETTAVFQRGKFLRDD
jgi:hypothetical protein